MKKKGSPGKERRLLAPKRECNMYRSWGQKGVESEGVRWCRPVPRIRGNSYQIQRNQYKKDKGTRETQNSSKWQAQSYVYCSCPVVAKDITPSS